MKRLLLFAFLLPASIVLAAGATEDSTKTVPANCSDSLYVIEHPTGFSIRNGTDSIAFITCNRLFLRSFVAYADKRMIIATLSLDQRSFAPSDLDMAVRVFYINDSCQLETYSFQNTDYNSGARLCGYFEYSNGSLIIKCERRVMETVPVSETIATFRKYFFEYYP